MKAMEAPHAHAPHVAFQRLLYVLDDIRRDSIRHADSPDLRKVHVLTVRQGAALTQLRLLTTDVPQGISLKQLATRLQMTVPATSLLVESMVSTGFFERRPNPNDRRSVCIKLSPKGHEVFESVYGNFRRRIDEMADNFSAEELATIERVALKLQSLRDACPASGR